MQERLGGPAQFRGDWRQVAWEPSRCWLESLPRQLSAAPSRHSKSVWRRGRGVKLLERLFISSYLITLQLADSNFPIVLDKGGSYEGGNSAGK